MSHQSCEEIQLGEARETWCAVERMKEEDWCRKQRAHIPRYQEEMKSDIFGFCVTSTQFEDRCTFEPPKARRREMKHYPKIHNKSQLKI
ncbi:protein SPATA45 [Biomphalaria pfeifferi]|uniref:Protein SPATA45 n=1 Tax=Biomphalaria pfeifferi TaxID=112525 RepID=A0AAD8B3U0_BIOPF|nr:protein SPATA45 [Biomphalaria pfeifferi]